MLSDRTITDCNDHIPLQSLPERSFMNRRTRSYLLFILLTGCICYLLSHFVIQVYFVSGSSMEPSYSSGQPVLIRKFGLPDCLGHGDVVVIHREDLGRDIIKRIVAVPGDTVRITDGVLYINDIPEENAAQLPAMEDAGNAASPILLGDGEYFVLGDNRNHSIDSRSDEIGIISSSSVKGKIIFPIVRLTSG